MSAHTADMNHDEVLKDIAAKLPVTPNTRKRGIWIACFVVGVISLVYLFAANPTRAWGAYAINVIFWLGLAQAGVVLAAAIRLTNGKWAGPIQRIGESFSSFMPVGFVLMLVLLVGGIWSVLPWTQHVNPRQAPYLNVPFLYIRTLGGILLFWWLANKLVKTSLRRDAHLLKPHVPESLKNAYEKLSANWRGDEEEFKHYRHEVSHLSPQIVLTFVVFFSVIGWDFIMSITPVWFSALFGWYVYAAAFLTGVCMVAFLATQFRTKYRLESYITPSHFWDIGKVIFAFSIFWVYLFWSQYLPIWYSNMPEETGWVFLRFEQPWRPLAFTVFTMIFAIPFLGMLNKTSKSNPFLLASFTVLIMAGVWLERHILVMPSLNPDTVWLGLGEVGVGIGFMGLFGWMVQGFVTKYPCVKVVDVLAGQGGHGH
jgi:Ni/Fe-hydrogenase subunit HybB-like protein